MFGKYFYNEGLRKVTVAFGAIFNKIQIVSMGDFSKKEIRKIGGNCILTKKNHKTGSDRIFEAIKILRRLII